MASYLYRTAQPFTLAIFRSWGSSTGAGRIRLAAANIKKNASPPDLLSQREEAALLYPSKHLSFQSILFKHLSSCEILDDRFIFELEGPMLI